MSPELYYGMIIILTFGLLLFKQEDNIDLEYEQISKIHKNNYRLFCVCDIVNHYSIQHFTNEKWEPKNWQTVHNVYLSTETKAKKVFLNYIQNIDKVVTHYKD